MWVRKRLDIAWSDLAYGCLRCAWPARRPLADADVAAGWMPPAEVLVCLSVRSGLDLLLSALRLPRGSEVVVSAINILDMARVIERHGHLVVPVDVEPTTYHASAESLMRAVSSRTRMIVIAHLFGGRGDIDRIADIAGRNGIFLVEDCAQAFAGRAYAGHSRSDVSLFSFGPIKTATALGGAVLRVKDAALLARMRKVQQGYPHQSRVRYLGRLVKYSILKILASGPVYGSVVRALRTLGADHDRLLHGRLRSFGGTADLLTVLRRQPGGPLRHVLRRRIARLDEARLIARQANGRRLANCLARRGLPFLAAESGDTFWVFPYPTHDTEGLAEWLLAKGFDVVRKSSLAALQPTSRDQPAPVAAERILRSLVFLPASSEMPERELERLAGLVAEYEARNATSPSPAAGSAA